MSDVLGEGFTREHFLQLIGSVRANGAFPDAPLLAVYDELALQLTQTRDERNEFYNVTVTLKDQLAQLTEFPQLVDYARGVQRLREQLAERDAMVGRLENDLCTAKDQIPPDMEDDSLSVALIKFGDLRRTLQARVVELEAVLKARGYAHE